MSEKIKYPPLFGNCVDCAGCNMLEDPEFSGKYRCPYYIPFKKITKEIKDELN